MSTPLQQEQFRLQNLPLNEAVRRELGLPKMSAGVEQALVSTMISAERAKLATAKRTTKLWTLESAVPKRSTKQTTRASASASGDDEDEDDEAQFVESESLGGSSVVRTMSGMVHERTGHVPHRENIDGVLDFDEHADDADVLRNEHQKDKAKVVRSSQFQYERTTLTRLLQSPAVPFIIACVSLLDSMLRIVRLAYSGPVTFRIDR